MVIKMVRQTGLALGVAVLVAVLGPDSAYGTPPLMAFPYTGGRWRDRPFPGPSAATTANGSVQLRTDR